MPNLRGLRAFDAVAQCNSVSQAAELVCVSQPAVTQSIAKVEAWFGCPLLDRRSTGSYLTDAGRLVLRRVERLFAEMNASVAALGGDVSAAPRIASMLTASQIRSLIEVARAHSFDEASKRLLVSRTALHRNARELEKIVGKTIYERTAAGMTTNPAGRELARRLVLAFSEIEAAVQEVGALRGEARSRIVIGSQPLAAGHVLALAVNDFLHAYPAATVEIVDGSYVSLLSRLRHGEVDLMFGPMKCPANIDDVTEEVLYRDCYRVVARCGHPLACRDDIATADLVEFDWIVPHVGTQRRAAFDRIFENTAKKPQISVNASSIAIQLSLMRNSDRLTLLTSREIADDPQTADFEALNYGLSISRPPDGITARANWVPTAPQARFMELLRDRSRPPGTQPMPPGEPEAAAAEMAQTCN
ncbi:LysR family transcriptional regulator [Jiella sp. MQZ13P-4]|uniref:LysR family transcriptional regulator n=2 Tax=Jiella sonneratiae TaxID=2816856 RepID=A0ABS3JAU7_9HYPH|nr:LysR family transcriptional regulator [Jiella sonneratiae]MBO0906083.1 LysR family transcriptional regulator [Jiella sonneratiae]